MPSFYEHLTISMIILIVVLFTISPSYAVLLSTFLVSSVFPDLDSKNSKVRKNAAIFIPIAISFFIVLGIETSLQTRIFAGLTTCLAAFLVIKTLPFSHRGKRSLHRKSVMVLFSAFLGAGVWLLFKTPEIWMIMTASLLGYILHMTADELFKRKNNG